MSFYLMLWFKIWFQFIVGTFLVIEYEIIANMGFVMITGFIGLNGLFLSIGFIFIVLIGCNKIGKLHDFFAFDWIVIDMLLD